MAGKRISFSSLHTRYSIPYTCRASRGVTLIDTIVGTALMLVIFMGIAAAFQLSVDVVSNNKARGSAIALAGERVEYMRSLAYASIGTSGGIPAGSIAQSESVVLNGVTFTRRTVVEYADDAKDGTGASDSNSITSDYKVGKVDVAWTSRNGTRHITLVSRFEPPAGMEIACTPPCGTLTVNVFNAASLALSGASVSIVNAGTSPAINVNTFTNASGTASFIGAPASSGYQIVVTKSGYSTAQTYSVTSQNTDPNPGHLTVSNNQTTSGTFVIDIVSTMLINTYSLATNTWTDSFSDESKLGPATTNIEVSGNRARFAGNQPWTEPADLYSQTITPVALSRWGVFSWNHTEPSETVITYHVYYPNGGTLSLLPDSILAGNSAGYTTGTSLDLSGVPANTYPSLVLQAHLLALNPSAPSPSIEDWSLTYQSGQGIVIPFTMRGAKTIGSGPSGAVYKYDNLLTTNSSGILTIPNLEWDTYSLSVAASTGYDIASSCTPQPIVVAPNTSVAVQLYLSVHTANSLLIDVKNSAGITLAGASVRLTKGGSYDETIATDTCGQAFFDGLTNGNYSVSVSLSGYATSTASGIDATGTSRFSVTLN